VPHTILDPATEPDAAHLIDRLGISKAELPLAVCPDGTVLRSPNEKALAQCLGLLPSFLADREVKSSIQNRLASLKPENPVGLKELKNVHLYMVPTLDVAGAEGFRSVSIDDGPIETLTMNLLSDAADWSNAVRNNAFVLKAAAQPLAAGRHTVKVWRIDGNNVLQKLFVDLGGLPVLYLGPSQNVAAKH